MEGMTSPRETARQIAEQFRMALVHVGADRECGVHESPEPGCCFCAWEAIASLTADLAQARQDIQAYRGSLGYPVPGEFGELLADGTRPNNGIAEALHQQLAAAEQARDEALRKGKAALYLVQKLAPQKQGLLLYEVAYRDGFNTARDASVTILADTFGITND